MPRVRRRLLAARVISLRVVPRQQRRVCGRRRVSASSAAAGHHCAGCRAAASRCVPLRFTQRVRSAARHGLGAAARVFGPRRRCDQRQSVIPNPQHITAARDARREAPTSAGR